MAIVDSLVAHWPVVVSMPLVAAAIGYLTKRAAIEMMFRPLHFVGIREPWLGWQGVVPRHSERMIRVSVDLLTEQLVETREIFARLDPDRLAKAVEGPLLESIDQITRDVMEQHRPGLWDLLPPLAKELVVKQVQAGSPALVRRVMRDLQEHIDEVLDIKQVAVDALTRDKQVLITLVRDISRPEMAFIARCGVYFGLVLGLVQTVVWALTREPLVLPVFGAAIGWFTDWLAIKLVFLPRRPVRIGPVTFQGVFQRRRDEVAKQYADIIARDVMNVPNIVDDVLRGPGSAKLMAMVNRAVLDAVDEHAARLRPLITATVGSQALTRIKHAAADRAVERFPETVRYAHDYAAEALDIRDTIAARMRRLTRVQYEGLLRPAFRQDEWKLIAVGAVIGGLIGELQVLLLLG